MHSHMVATDIKEELKKKKMIVTYVLPSVNSVISLIQCPALSGIVTLKPQYWFKSTADLHSQVT